MKRIAYIDALRGLAMLLVVMGHASMFSFNSESLLNCFVDIFHVPLFFFISGFLAHKSMNGIDAGQLISRIWSKTRELLIPTAVFVILYFGLIQPYTTPFGLTYSLIKGYFTAYWFTFTLFLIFFIYYFACVITSKIKKIRLFLLCTLFLISFVCPIVIYKLCPQITWRGYNSFDWADAWLYLQYFLLGAFAGYNKSIYHKLNESNWFKTIVIAGFVLSVAFNWQYDFALAPRLMKWIYSLNGMLSPYFGLLTCVVFFYHIKDYFETDALWSRLLKWIGQRTLDVYLIHYFFIGNFTKWGNLISPDNILLEIIISFSLSLVIIALSILVGNIIRSSNILASIVLGAKPLKKLSSANS